MKDYRIGAGTRWGLSILLDGHPKIVQLRLGKLWMTYQGPKKNSLTVWFGQQRIC